MAKPPKPGKCVHCLRDSVERNWDHVFPLSWYPDSFRVNAEKWKIPSCIPCNARYGKLEEDLLARMGLCLDPDHIASRSIVEKVLRATRPSMARSDRDRMGRAALKRRVLEDVREGAEIPQTGIFPGLGERWQRPLEEQTAVLIRASSLHDLTYKIVRGIFYIEDGKFIEPPYVIEFFALDEEGSRPVREAIDRWGETFARAPGLVVRRAVSSEDGLSSLFEIEFWGQFKTYASVMRSE